jgi:hypothetical protein
VKIYELRNRYEMAIGISVVYLGGGMAGLGHHVAGFIIALIGGVIIYEQEAK